MSIKVMNWVWEHSDAAGNERLVLLAIADNADDDGSNAWPSRATLAAKTLLDERTVRRIIKRLEAAGRLRVESGNGRTHSNRYTVVMHAPAAPETGAERPRANCPRAICPRAARPRKGGQPVRERGARCHPNHP